MTKQAWRPGRRKGGPGTARGCKGRGPRAREKSKQQQQQQQQQTACPFRLWLVHRPRRARFRARSANTCSSASKMKFAATRLGLNGMSLRLVGPGSNWLPHLGAFLLSHLFVRPHDLSGPQPSVVAGFPGTRFVCARKPSRMFVYGLAACREAEPSFRCVLHWRFCLLPFALAHATRRGAASFATLKAAHFAPFPKKRPG